MSKQSVLFDSITIGYRKYRLRQYTRAANDNSNLYLSDFRLRKANRQFMKKMLEKIRTQVKKANIDKKSESSRFVLVETKW